jgi:pimeloyl-ACP methyl ester carboxylesterase
LLRNIHGKLFASGGKANRPFGPDRRNEFLGLSPSGFHKISYVDWGPIEDKRPVICVHGLTRQGRDFDHLAVELAAAGRRVICPDLVGRGRSGRIDNPRDYSLPQYCSDMNALIARLGVREVDWVGTSLGGLIGMVMAGFSGSILRKLVINDIGPFVSSAGLRRIGGYLREMPTSFETLADAEQYFRTVLAPYGELSDEHWAHLTIHSVLQDDETGRCAMLCDPMIAKAFTAPWFYSSLDLWRYWEAIDVPILVLHGGKSDLLSRDLTTEMRRRNLMASLVRFDDHGHVPPLMDREQVAIVAAFLQP